MFTHPDSAVNAALVEALFASAREIGDSITFDWSRNGTFDHEFADLSTLVTEVELERPALVTDLPEGVNTIQGYSSAELRVTLKGSRDSEELPVSELLSPFFARGPFYNRDLTGTAVRYWKTVYTDTGPVEVRQFTGLVRDIQFNRKDETVELLCSDIVRWANADVTLPHWAIDKSGTEKWEVGAARPINAAWVVAECLRQAGTPIGPLPRPDAMVFISGNGALLPSVGGKFHATFIQTDQHVLPTKPEGIWKDGKYGPALKPIKADGSEGSATSWSSGERLARVPRNGSTDAPLNVGFNAWCESDGTATNRPHPGDDPTNGNFAYLEGHFHYFSLDDGPNPNLIFQVGRNGQVYFAVITATGEIFKWTWGYQTKGWHYYDLNVRFTSKSITPVLTVDGTLVPLLTGTPATKGFTYGAYPGADALPSHRLFVFDPAQHFQVYAGPPSGSNPAVYRPGQEHPPTTADGLPYVDFRGCVAELSFIPDTWHDKVWTVLQKVAAAEFAALYTNEYGQLIWRPHAELRTSTPTVPQASYTVANLLDMIVNPSLDQYKNAITLAYVDRNQEPADAWTPDSGLSFLVPDDGQWHYTDRVRIEDAVQFATDVVYLCGRDPGEIKAGTTDQTELQRRVTREFNEMMRRDHSSTTAVFAEDVRRDGVNAAPTPSTDLRDWNSNTAANPVKLEAWVVPDLDQRNVRIKARVTPDSRTAGLYVGANVLLGSYGSDVPNPTLTVRATSYSDPRTNWYSVDDPAGVAERGRFTLILDANDWRQTIGTAVAIAPQLLADTIVPAPIITNLSLPCDPRLQLADVIGLTSGSGITGTISAQVVGIRRAARGSNDSIDVRVLRTPSKWALGVPGASELGQTTYLN